MNLHTFLNNRISPKNPRLLSKLGFRGNTTILATIKSRIFKRYPNLVF